MDRALLPLAAALALPLAAGAAPLTLDEALALAARQNHDLAIARADAEAAGADAAGSLAGVLPRLDLSASAARQFFGPGTQQGFDPVTGQIITGAADYPAYAYSLQLSLPVVDVGAWKQVAQARAGERAAARTFDEARLGLAFDVTRRFYELLKAERSLRVLEKAAARSEELVARADALFAAGRAQRSDTLAARINLGNDRIAVEQGRTRLEQARVALATALGEPGDASVEAVAPAALEAPGAPGQEPPPLPRLVELARSRRPALAAAAAQEEAAGAAVDAARAGYWPTLGAQASYGRSGYQLTGQDGVLDDPSRLYAASAGLVLSWNLFEGRRTVAAVQRAEVALARTRAGAARTSDAVAGELAGARQAVVALARQVGLSAENLVAAEQGASLARQRLEAGLASQLEVRDASLKLTMAELSLVQARIDHAVAVADLARAAGGAL